MFSYLNQKLALEDGIKLAQAMAYKLALAEIPRGGAKAIIMGDPKKDKTAQLLKTFGELLEFLGGQICTGEDMGIGIEDLKIISSETKYCAQGWPTALAAAKGVYGGIKACFKKVFGNESFRNKKIAIQGIGKIGYELANLVYKSGGDLTLADINSSVSEKAAKDFNAKAVEAETIYRIPCDVFSPCAMGNVITDDTIKHLKCKIIAGGANNQLQKEELANELLRKDILYVPDYLINSGGVMTNWFKKDANWAEGEIYNRVSELLEKAESQSKPPAILAGELAEEKYRQSLEQNEWY